MSDKSTLSDTEIPAAEGPGQETTGHLNRQPSPEDGQRLSAGAARQLGHHDEIRGGDSRRRSYLGLVSPVGLRMSRSTVKTIESAYSCVCRAGHVLADDIAEEPPIEESGRRLCNRSGCFEPVFTHCPQCGEPISGYIDAPRYETNRGVSRPIGRFEAFVTRTWREDCPYCKVPYPWARRAVWVGYHHRFLEDKQRNSPGLLTYVAQAEEAYEADKKERDSRARQRQPDKPRALITGNRRRPDKGLLEWFKDLSALLQGLVALGTILFVIAGVAGVRATTTSSTAPTKSSKSSCSSPQREDLGLSNQGKWPPFPSAPGPCQVILAHGDLHNAGGCQVTVFREGEPVQGLSVQGIFRIVRYTGPADYINGHIRRDQQAAAADAGMPCPFI